MSSQTIISVVQGKEFAITCENKFNEEGNPTGGNVESKGIRIDWQDGPLYREKKRIPQSGAFIEDVILACIQRLEFFQSSKFACDENQYAIIALKTALSNLERRTQARTAKGVEGTYGV